MCKPQYYFCFLIQKAFSSSRLRTKVLRVGWKNGLCAKSMKKEQKENPAVTTWRGVSLERENVLFSNLFVYLLYNKSICCNLNKKVNKLLTMLKTC